MASVLTLKLVLEGKISELISCSRATNRWEASGILVKEGCFFVVFDNRSEIARLSANLRPTAANGLFGMARANYGYEGITYNAALQRYYLLVEVRNVRTATTKH